MTHRQQGDHAAGLHRPGPLENADESVLDVRGFAARYVLLGIAGARVSVRRKADGAVGTLAYHLRPLLFRDFRPASGGQRP